MTYCVGMVLDKGLVLMSDTRTNSGVDNISVFRKMFRWSVPGQRMISLLTAGNLATTQSVISRLEERTKAPGDRHNSLLELPTMFQVAAEVGKLLRDVVPQHGHHVAHHLRRHHRLPRPRHRGRVPRAAARGAHAR